MSPPPSSCRRLLHAEDGIEDHAAPRPGGAQHQPHRQPRERLWQAADLPAEPVRLPPPPPRPPRRGPPGRAPDLPPEPVRLARAVERHYLARVAVEGGAAPEHA